MQWWQRHAADLADRLASSGRLADPALRAAFANIPRHAFAPRVFRNDPTRGWLAVADTDPDYQDVAYADEPLITQLDGDPAAWQNLRRTGIHLGGVPTSSSSSPTLMALMLDALALEDGMRVLEVGTGSGYNAAVLSARLGDQAVTSVDVDCSLVDAARDRLSRLGHHPRLACMDALHAVPDDSFDRIEVTVAIPAVPACWLDHVRPGGLILANLTSGLLSDAMFALTVDGAGTASGTALPDSVWFMPTRNAYLPPAYQLHAQLDNRNSSRITTRVPFAATSDDNGFATLLALTQRTLQHYVTDNADTWNWLIAPDGAWVHHLPDGSIEQGGPRRLWPVIEDLWTWWQRHDQPTRTRLGLTVTDSRQYLWLDNPNNPVEFNI